MAKDTGKSEDKYLAALAGKKIAAVTLDHKWHQLLTRVGKTRRITEKEKELNELLRRQGKCNTETQSIRKLKKKLMDEIVSLMEKQDATSIKKTEDNKRLINECNEKMEQYQDELLELPKMIDEVNKELMAETMHICYENMHANEKDIKEIADWIAQVRVELKKNVVRKQEMEIANQEIYSFMHDIFGSDVIDLFDMKYNPEKNPVIHAKE